MLDLLQFIANNIIPSQKIILSDEEILRYNRKSLLVTTPINTRYLDKTSLRLTLAPRWRRQIPNQLELGIIDSNSLPGYEYGTFVSPVSSNTSFQLHPRQNLICSTDESISIPDGIIAVVSTIKQMVELGLFISTSTVLFDHRGPIIFNMLNITNHPIRLHPSLEVLQITFIKYKGVDNVESNIA